MTEPERPPTDWEARVAKAKREGTWFLPEEEPSPYPPRVKRVLFLKGAATGIVLMAVLGLVLDLVTGGPAKAFRVDAFLDRLVSSLFLALWLGWWFTRPPRAKR